MTEQLNATESRPLVIGLPGFGDRADYASYESWSSQLPQLGVDVAMVDIYGLPDDVTYKLEEGHSGNFYYSRIEPYDYFEAIRQVIDKRRPTETVLCGLGWGGSRAMENAFALSHRGIASLAQWP